MGEIRQVKEGPKIGTGQAGGSAELVKKLSDGKIGRTSHSVHGTEYFAGKSIQQ